MTTVNNTYKPTYYVLQCVITMAKLYNFSKVIMMTIIINYYY